MLAVEDMMKAGWEIKLSLAVILGFGFKIFEYPLCVFHCACGFYCCLRQRRRDAESGSYEKGKGLQFLHGTVAVIMIIKSVVL